VVVTVDRAVCLNLDDRTDRWAGFLGSVRATRAFGRVDLRRFAASAVETHAVPRWWDKHPPYQYLVGLDHQTILRAAYADGCESVAVFEDDARFAADFDAVFGPAWHAVQRQAGWHGLYLGGDDRVMPTWIGPDLRLLHGTVKSHAYVLSRAGIFRVLEHLAYWPRQVVDWSMHDLQKIEPHYFAPGRYVVHQAESFPGDREGRRW
jgi:hypothetical protein